MAVTSSRTEEVLEQQQQQQQQQARPTDEAAAASLTPDDIRYTASMQPLRPHQVQVLGLLANFSALSLERLHNILRFTTAEGRCAPFAAGALAPLHRSRGHVQVRCCHRQQQEQPHTRRFSASMEELDDYLLGLSQQGFVSTDARGWYQLSPSVQLLG